MSSSQFLHNLSDESEEQDIDQLPLRRSFKQLRDKKRSSPRPEPSLESSPPKRSRKKTAENAYGPRRPLLLKSMFSFLFFAPVWHVTTFVFLPHGPNVLQRTIKLGSWRSFLSDWFLQSFLFILRSAPNTAWPLTNFIQIQFTIWLDFIWSVCGWELNPQLVIFNHGNVGI